MNLWKNL